MSKDKKEREAVPKDKKKLSRVTRRHQKEAKKKRRVILIVVLVVGAILAAGAIFNIPYINVARKGGFWLGGKLSGAPGKESPPPEYLFMTQPRSGKTLEGDVSILLAVCKGDASQRAIMDLALFTYNTELGEGEVYLVPETSIAYNLSGQKIELSQALKQEGGMDLLRSTVANMSGSDVDYLVLLGFNGAMQAFQGLEFPPVLLEKDLVLPNPVSGDTNHLSKGQEIGDADRLLSYLLASDAKGAREARLERAKSYLPEALYALKGEDPAVLGERLSSLGGEALLEPGTGSGEEDGRYLASMVQAFSGLEEGKLNFKAVPRVEVLNGCGLPDLGKKVGEKLASLGVGVAGTGGNAKVTVDGQETNDFTHQESSIIYRSQDRRVEAFARYLGVLLSMEDLRFEPGPGPEVVIIAGKDLAG